MSSARREELTTVGGLSILAAFLCFITAVIFGCVATVQLGPGTANEAPNIASAGAACGFGVAAGLCLVAAAIAESGATRRREAKSAAPTVSEPTPPGLG